MVFCGEKWEGKVMGARFLKIMEIVNIPRTVRQKISQQKMHTQHLK
jgi:hypothetical protein